MVDKNPENFGPKGGQLQRDLKEAAKTPEELQDEADKNKQKDWDNAESIKKTEKEYQAFLADEAKEKAAEEFFQAQKLQHEQEFANWKVAEQKKLDDEVLNAQLQDKMGKWRQNWDDQHKGSQTFNDAPSLRDAIQSAVRGPDKDPTAVEQLEVQREMAASLKKLQEQKDAQGPARLG